MSKKPTELEAAALTHFTPAGQAALYHIHLAQQAEKDEKLKLENEKKKEKKLREESRPEEVKAGEIVDNWIQDWCPPLYQFLNIFASPHLAIGIFISLHFAFWYTTPWHFHFFISWPVIHFIPIYCTWKSIYTTKDRILWLSYWPILCVIEYLEVLLFKDQARAMIWWPKIKAIFCVMMYSIIDNEVVLDSRGKPKDKKPVFGAIKIMEKFLPSPPKEREKPQDDKEKDRESSKGREKEKDRTTSRNKEEEKKMKGKDRKKTK
ncbi:uncharacterized protein L201_002831 [Kwoniella dendrophila CBS 6074]|uniref:Translocation protein SEC62 n=1 Tax=Kwoniella dendrophila CBS 6074 TaxID=1295534 RepID=A0AAX4JR67_9TREE